MVLVAGPLLARLLLVARVVLDPVSARIDENASQMEASSDKIDDASLSTAAVSTFSSG